MNACKNNKSLTFTQDIDFWLNLFYAFRPFYTIHLEIETCDLI